MILTRLALYKPLVPLASHISALLFKQVRSFVLAYCIVFRRVHIMPKQRKSRCSQRTMAHRNTAQSTVRATSADVVQSTQNYAAMPREKLLFLLSGNAWYNLGHGRSSSLASKRAILRTLHRRLPTQQSCRIRS